jgi:hypothetical protein
MTDQKNPLNFVIGKENNGKSIGDFIQDHIENGNVIIKDGKVFRTEKGSKIRSLQEIPDLA